MNPIDKSFWDSKHSDVDPWWLSGTNLDVLLEFHSIDKNFLENKTILEIGVGTGSCTRELSLLTPNIFCCDISDVALDRVKEYSALQVNTKNIKTLPEVDIAISHLVFQHCTDDEVYRLINDVNLTENGFFSFQFAALKDNIIHSNIQNLIDRGELFFRSVEKIKEIVNSSNKEIFYISNPKWWGGKNLHEWYCIKIRNKR